MDRTLGRRTVLALSAASLVGACTQAVVTIVFSAQPSAVATLLIALDDFSARYGYRKSGELGVSDILSTDVVRDEYAEYQGPRTKFCLGGWAGTPGEFAATFRPKDDWWLFGLHADLYAIADEFRRVVSQIEGVSVEEGYQ